MSKKIYSKIYAFCDNCGAPMSDVENIVTSTLGLGISAALKAIGTVVEPENVCLHCIKKTADYAAGINSDAPMSQVIADMGMSADMKVTLIEKALELEKRGFLREAVFKELKKEGYL
jgi:hypothetical protein